MQGSDNSNKFSKNSFFKNVQMQLKSHINESSGQDTVLDANWIKYKEILNEIKVERNRNIYSIQEHQSKILKLQQSPSRLSNGKSNFIAFKKVKLVSEKKATKPHAF